MRSPLLLLLALSLSSTLHAFASPSPTLFDLESLSLPSTSHTSASARRALFDLESTSASPHTGLSAFSKRASTKISSYSGPTKGHATFYGNDGSGGACLLPSRSDLKFVAFSGAKWDNSANCGACMRVTGPNGSSLDLSTSAFSKIAPTSKGKVDVSWKWISCVSAGLEKGGVSVVWKSGSSAYWMAIQIRGAAFPVQSVAIRAATSSSYTNLKRENYNYFSATSGAGAGPFVVLVRYQNGSKSIIKNVKLNSVIGDA
ncbi:RlpA-like double-psi beta-barrel-protein domain-containing protein-containing protein [Leucosporidium creatinivorum]|uniref:RlpA-like double-psi beta-barrel-protein domain-containing protein-containing protein n=1 Tax=Leucosporidium creatinivorum TaxID=106004 RepID=A0A1Y2FVG1_9BASI|nr:RlpA-like double-psi beta-barrel-protein domain-containing protein-containing protein [Leucosporidium creatinivorum]